MKVYRTLIIPWRKGDLLYSPDFENHCCKEVEREVGKMLCFPRRGFLHYVMLLEIEAKLTRWAPSVGQACIHVPANSPWCGVTCREATGGSLVESPKGLGGMSVGQLLSEGSLMGWANFTLLPKDQFKSSSVVLPLLTTFGSNHRSCLLLSVQRTFFKVSVDSL